MSHNLSVPPPLLPHSSNFLNMAPPSPGVRPVGIRQPGQQQRPSMQVQPGQTTNLISNLQPLGALASSPVMQGNLSQQSMQAMNPMMQPHFPVSNPQREGEGQQQQQQGQVASNGQFRLLGCPHSHPLSLTSLVSRALASAL